MKLTLKKVPDRGLDIRTWNEINSDDKVCKYPPSYYDNLCQYPNRQISMALLLIVYDNDDECQQIYVHDQSIYIQTKNADNAQNENDKTSKVAEIEVISGSCAIFHFAGRHIPACIGRTGVKSNKSEGDGGTPSGFLPLRRLLYRPDRVHLPPTSLASKPLTESDGWCDDVNHPDYNLQVRLPHPARHEKLWLENRLYDIIGILGYNDDPVIPGRGSAIFLHVSDMQPTQGCIALSLKDLYWVLEQGLEAIFIPNS
ncbi:unnamed protein product [Rotaria magnacalcarata]|uniref:L,D-TPase catalytic domain-containing protein n=1 Tax=Rotaria magnacalcarata TaxID=392030 RepID=A0A816TM54_9BILA|nr:unnamed protein product [Rotaria magnacalcarata]